MTSTGLPTLVTRLAEDALEFLFPTRCAGCDLPGELLCPACLLAMPLIAADEACSRCGAPLGGGDRCRECDGLPLAFSAARCLGVLDGPLSRAVTLFKDADERRLAEPLAGLLAGVSADLAARAVAAVPIPASRVAVLRRGYDHGHLLAAAYARAAGLPVLDALVHLGRRDQRRLGRLERREAAADALGLAPGAVVPHAAVVLIDDVMTTGATLDAAARVLLGAGATEVFAVTVARACDARTPRGRA